MSTPDPLHEFSHLPTVDEQETAAERTSRLWEKHRKNRQPAADPQSAVPPPPPAPEAPLPADWNSLLDLEPEVPLMPAPPPRRERVRTVIRSSRSSDTPQSEAPQSEAPQSEAPHLPPQESSSPAQLPPEVPESSVAVNSEPVRKKSERRSEAKRKGEDAPRDQREGPSGKAEPTQSEAKENPEKHPDSEKPAAALPPAKAPEPVAPEPAWRKRWEKVGGRALSLSLVAHVVIISAAALIVVHQVSEEPSDFLPGGGTAQGQAASQDLQHKIQEKKNPWLKRAMPVRKLAAVNTISDIVLPEDAPDFLDLPTPQADFSKGTFGGGMGLAGGGGGFGTGMGLGSREGMTFQALTLFGREIKAKRLAVVLDVSASMAPHLPRVIAEVDKVAKGSVVVLFVGCGLEPPPPRGLDGEEVYRTSGQEFERFWRTQGGTLEEARKLRYAPSDPIPSEDIYRMLARRPQTFFIHSVGISYAWLALLSNEVRSADALYWFSDFQDRADFRQLGIVRENLANRKQRLYIHAYMRGDAFDLITSQLVKPSGGDVIEEMN